MTPPPPAQKSSKLPADFLSPTGSLTPAAAGAIVLLIANTLGAVFNVPRAATALILSGIIGALIVAKFQAPIAARIGYWVLNSLTIFTVAMGSNGIAVGAAPHVQAGGGVSTGFWAPWL